MKIIRITTDNEISAHDFPEGDYGEQNRALKELIGPRCKLYEHVMPRRLYTELGGSNKICREPGRCVGMLVDEEGSYNDVGCNIAGSYLYESDKHGCPILGNVLIVGETYGNDGIDFCGISEGQFAILYPKLEKLTKKAGEYV